MSKNNTTYISMSTIPGKEMFKGYKPIELPFTNLHKLIQTTPYTMHTLKGGYRRTPNAILTGNTLVVDIDNDQYNENTGNLYRLTYEEAKTLSSKYKSLIITTGSHQKDKGDHGIEDRYRILFYLDTPLNPTQADYGTLIEDCLKELGFYKYADKGASKDKVKYFKTSPLNSTYHYSEATSIFDWKKHDIAPPPKPIRKASNNYADTQELKDIKENMSYEFLAFHCGVPLPVTKRSQNEIHYDCPFHNSSAKIAFHVAQSGPDKNMWICHGCEDGGSVVDFAMKALQIDEGKAIKLIKKLNKQ